MIELRIHGEPQFDVYELIDVYEAHRHRFLEQLPDLSGDDWAAPSRCSEWTVHQVVRHLADINELGVDDSTSSPFDNFDPRTTPRRWMKPSEGETPADTLERFRSGSAAYFARARAAADAGLEHFVEFPFGKEPWPVMTAHGFWDSWVHERDVLLPLGREHRTDDIGTQFATTYALFISSAVAVLFGTPINATFELAGTGRGAYEVVHDGAGAIVRSSPKDVITGPDAGALSDALSGRGRIDELIEAPPAGLSALANFFNTPV